MKKVFITITGFVVLFVGVYIFIKMNPPLSAYSSAFTMDKQVQLVEVGNKSPLGGIQIEAVLVNNNTLPTRGKIQVSDHKKGLIISDDFNGKEESEYNFKELDSVILNPKTDPQKQLDKVSASTATIYALSLGHEECIDKVIIKYRHLGISHEMTVLTN